MLLTKNLLLFYAIIEFSLIPILQNIDNDIQRKASNCGRKFQYDTIRKQAN